MKVYIRWMHKIAPKASDVEGPFDAERHDLVDRTAVQKWWRRKVDRGGGLGRLSDFRIEKDGAVLCFNPEGYSTMHGVYIEPPGACSVARFGPARTCLPGGDVDNCGGRLT